MLVYRSASGTLDSVTPRPQRDTLGPKRGLSCFKARATCGYEGKVLEIDTTKLGPSLRIEDHKDGHVSIVPEDKEKGIDDLTLAAWANARGTQTGDGHPLTRCVLGAVVRVLQRNEE